MRLFKRGPVYWLSWFDNGREHRRTTKCTDKKAAQLVFLRAQRERADPHHAATRKATVASASTRFLKELNRTARSVATIDVYSCKVGHLNRLLGDVSLADLTHAKVQAYVDQREEEGVVPHTVHKELMALRRVLKSAARAGEFNRDTKAVIPEHAERYTPRTRWLTEDELLAVCSYLPPRRAAFVAFIVATGARLSEALAAERGDVTSGGIRIRGQKTQKAKRVIPLLPFAWPLLAFTLAHADGDARMFAPWLNFRRDVAKACERAGVPCFTPNDLRRTTATWLVKRGVPLNLVAKVLGHASTAMLERVYGQLDSQDVGRLIGMHFGGEHLVQNPVQAPDRITKSLSRP